MVKGEKEVKVAEMCTDGEKKGREIAFIQLLSWARHPAVDELTVLHPSL